MVCPNKVYAGKNMIDLTSSGTEYGLASETQDGLMSKDMYYKLSLYSPEYVNAGTYTTNGSDYTTYLSGKDWGASGTISTSLQFLFNKYKIIKLSCNAKFYATSRNDNDRKWYFSCIVCNIIKRSTATLSGGATASVNIAETIFLKCENGEYYKSNKLEGPYEKTDTPYSYISIEGTLSPAYGDPSATVGFTVIVNGEITLDAISS